MEFDQNTAQLLATLVTAKNGSTDTDAADRKVNSERLLTLEVALENAMRLSDSEAHEVWRVVQLLVNHDPVLAESSAVVLLAREFDPFPATWRTIADKALKHAHLKKNR